MSHSRDPNLASQSDDMEGIQSQLSQLTMEAHDTQDSSTENTTTQAVSEAALAANWIRIFENNYPTRTHVLDSYHGSNQCMIDFIRSWFASQESNTFPYLDDLANDPHFGEFNDSLANDESSISELEYPDKAYGSVQLRQMFGTALPSLR
jgi:hypothetical protein